MWIVGFFADCRFLKIFDPKKKDSVKKKHFNTFFSLYKSATYLILNKFCLKEGNLKSGLRILGPNLGGLPSLIDMILNEPLKRNA